MEKDRKHRKRGEVRSFDCSNCPRLICEEGSARTSMSIPLGVRLATAEGEYATNRLFWIVVLLIAAPTLLGFTALVTDQMPDLLSLFERIKAVFWKAKS